MMAASRVLAGQQVRPRDAALLGNSESCRACPLSTSLVDGTPCLRMCLLVVAVTSHWQCQAVSVYCGRDYTSDAVYVVVQCLELGANPGVIG